MQFGALLPSMMATEMLSRILVGVQQRLLEPAQARAVSAYRKLSAVRRPIAASGLLFVGLVMAAGLNWGIALLAFITMAIMIASDAGENDRDAVSTAAGNEAGSRPPAPRDRNNESWRPLVDAIPEPAVALDASGNVMHHNALVLDLFPMARAGYPLSHMSRNPELNQAVERAMNSAEPVIVQLFERIPVERRISATVSRLAGSRERRDIPRLLVTFRDLTEQDRLAQMRADFIANASHELRTPLASLRGFVETLQGPARDDPSARARFLGIMASQAMRMTRLIDDLLSLSRVEMRVHLPPKGIVDLNEVASYVAQALEPLAEASKVKLFVSKLDGSAARVRGDRDELVQVLQNLVHNAIKYGREGGHVEIAVSRVMDGSPPHQRLLLAVGDDGPGIAPEHLPRLTERFYRANVNASREKGGTGLGLAIVKHIVIRHRGELRISSEIGKGSTFAVLFEELDRAQSPR